MRQLFFHALKDFALLLRVFLDCSGFSWGLPGLGVVPQFKDRVIGKKRKEQKKTKKSAEKKAKQEAKKSAEKEAEKEAEKRAEKEAIMQRRERSKKGAVAEMMCPFLSSISKS